MKARSVKKGLLLRFGLWVLRPVVLLVMDEAHEPVEDNPKVDGFCLTDDEISRLMTRERRSHEKLLQIMRSNPRSGRSN